MAKIPKNLPQNGHGSWAVNIDVFQQKRSVHQKAKVQKSSIKAKGSDKVNKDEKNTVKTAVNQFNQGVREAKNIRPMRTFNIRKPD